MLHGKNKISMFRFVHIDFIKQKKCEAYRQRCRAHHRDQWYPNMPQSALLVAIYAQSVSDNMRVCVITMAVALRVATFTHGAKASNSYDQQVYIIGIMIWNICHRCQY